MLESIRVSPNILLTFARVILFRLKLARLYLKSDSPRWWMYEGRASEMRNTRKGGKSIHYDSYVSISCSSRFSRSRSICFFFSSRENLIYNFQVRVREWAFMATKVEWRQIGFTWKRGTPKLRESWNLYKQSEWMRQTLGFFHFCAEIGTSLWCHWVVRSKEKDEGYTVARTVLNERVFLSDERVWAAGNASYDRI